MQVSQNKSSSSSTSLNVGGYLNTKNVNAYKLHSKTKSHQIKWAKKGNENWWEAAGKEEGEEKRREEERRDEEMRGEDKQDQKEKEKPNQQDETIMRPLKID